MSKYFQEDYLQIDNLRSIFTGVYCFSCRESELKKRKYNFIFSQQVAVERSYEYEISYGFLMKKILGILWFNKKKKSLIQSMRAFFIQRRSPKFIGRGLSVRFCLSFKACVLNKHFLCAGTFTVVRLI